ncbi:MAG: hypothetical protein FWG94_05285 [Oscillospiraceae bacterium]|nr:hypothetical protein [Oscillospiraceae bacterium]
MRPHKKSDLIKVAKLYYLTDLTQDEIAASFGYSRSKVSRMLTQAKEQRIVQFRIAEQGNLQNELQEELIKRFGLLKAMVVPSTEPELIKAMVGQTAAKFLREHLRDNMLIGIQWGSTANCMIEAYEGKVLASNVEIMQITGGMHISNHITGGIETIKKLANKMDVNYHVLQYPMVVSSAVLAKMIMEDDNREYFARMKQMDMVFLGLGSSIPEESAAYLGGYISLDDAAELVRQGLAADVCGHRLNLDGTQADTVFSGRMVTIPLETIRNVHLRVGVAVGPYKKESILAAIKGGYLNVLIADDICALSILEGGGIY